MYIYVNIFFNFLVEKKIFFSFYYQHHNCNEFEFEILEQAITVFALRPVQLLAFGIRGFNFIHFAI